MILRGEGEERSGLRCEAVKRDGDCDDNARVNRYLTCIALTSSPCYESSHAARSRIASGNRLAH